MTNHRWGLRIARAILLLVTAFLALFQMWGTLFAIGDGDGKVGVLQGILLAGTGLGILVLPVAAFGAFSTRTAFAHAGLIGGLLVAPMAVLFGWGGLRADIINSLHGYHVGALGWIMSGGALPLTLMTILTSWKLIGRNN